MFQHKTSEELRGDPALRAHGLRFLNALENIVTNLEDMAMGTELLAMIGTTHASRSITPMHFKVSAASVHHAAARKPSTLLIAEYLRCLL